MNNPSRSGRSRRRMMNEINVVPYIDVMLVLLVIFMVTAPLVTPAQVELPSVQKSQQAPVQPLEIVIKADTNLRIIDRDKGYEKDLERKDIIDYVKSRQAEKNPKGDLPVVISADKNVKYEAVLNMMDDLQKNAVRKIGLTVKPVPAK
ncbi:MAG TPA: biopolymer transporter ExbD [Burkholderiales bacterium]|jgi:biopolymer transport protein TolR|nr:biopolymer transporter ExbD [Burkholderiales bacterium]